MRKFIFILFLTISLSSVYAGTYSTGRKEKATTEAGQNSIILTVEGNVVHVQNVHSRTYLEIYDILGVKISSFTIDSPEKTITLHLPKGCYILKIQDVVRKIAIK